ncbi:NAD(P)-binding protein [Melanomma pulvis-pyrius CBS 109.77]|uniref:NAD(P)-binding protein n=1 Tax=Melanomma pulvis-pyrius CBS 109.77 TaxID=1314802 RepID=A0A6A6XQK3_9PLEO|nr:NAD(P)-binding protein [Melanomma pulvis-pyrius CBS 109.77]
MGFIFTFLKSQLFTRLPYPTSDFSGQTVIITGSNTGLGLEAARHIVRLGAAKVILAVRTIAKGEAAAKDIIQSTNAKKNTIEVWELNLSDYNSVKAFNARVQALDRLDALIQNAGILTSNFSLIEDNESHITINVISSALIGLGVLPKLKETSEAFNVKTRLTFVGSDLLYVAKFKEADMTGKLLDILSEGKDVDMADRYNVSKLLLLYTVREFTARSPLGSQSNVVIDYLTPGACKSDIFRDDMGWLRRAMMSVATFLVARTTEVGSRTLVHAAKPEIENEAHGAFLMDCKVAPGGPNVDSPKGQKQQKQWIEELLPKLESISPGVTKVLL